MRHLKQFSKRVLSDWLPSFCDARDEAIAIEGFIEAGLDRLSEHDAMWFMRAIDAGYVTETEGFFVSDLSKAKEAIFWADKKADNPRKLHLWLEPIITIGAAARLVEEFSWPASQIGLQSEYPWPFDLIGYDKHQETEYIACEIKKDVKEVQHLLSKMELYCSQPALEHEPQNQAARNAYRKVVGLRKSMPPLFWALGPGGYGKVFNVSQNSELGTIILNPIDEKALRCPSS